MGQLGKELFELIEESQGFAFIADDIEEMADEEVIKIAVAALYHTKETARKLTKFIKHNAKNIKQPIK